TAFVDLIANCYSNRCESDDPNSFARRVALDNAVIRTHLEFKDNSTFRKTLTEPKFIEESEIVYLAQGELERYIGRESDLKKLIENAKQFLRQELPRFTIQLQQINDLIQRLRLGDALALPAYPDHARVRDLTQVVDGSVREVIEDIEKAEKELRALETGVREHAKALTRKQEIEARLTKLLAESKALLDRRNRLKEARSKRDDLFARLLGTVLNQRKRYADVIA